MSSRKALVCPSIRHRHYLDDEKTYMGEYSHFRFLPGVRADVNAENKHLVV